MPRRRSALFSACRRASTLHEGDLFDYSRLYASLGRIDALNLFEPVAARDVRIIQDPEGAVASITISLKERPRGSWNVSGPVGPIRFAGPFQASIASRLPAWGRGLLEAVVSSYWVPGFTVRLRTPTIGRQHRRYPRAVY